MTAKEADAVRALWDALSEYIEDPMSDVLPGSVKEMGLEAIEKARETWPNGVR